MWEYWETRVMYSGVVVVCAQQKGEPSCAAPVGAQLASSERQSPPRPAGSPHTASSWPSSLRLLAERRSKVGKCVSSTGALALFFQLQQSFSDLYWTLNEATRRSRYLHAWGGGETYKGPATADPAGCCRTPPSLARWTTPGPAASGNSPRHL